MAENPFLQAVNSVDKGGTSAPAQTGSGSNPFLQAVQTADVSKPVTPKVQIIQPQPQPSRNIFDATKNFFGGVIKKIQTPQVVPQSIRNYAQQELTKMQVTIPERSKPVISLDLKPKEPASAKVKQPVTPKIKNEPLILPEYRNVIDVYKEVAEGKNMGALEKFAKGVKESFRFKPLVGSIEDISNLLNKKDDEISKKAQALYPYSAKDSIAYKAGAVLSQIPEFAAEFVLTGGIFAAGKTATVKALTKIGMPSLVQRAGGTIIGGIAQGTIGGAPRIAAKTVEYSLPKTSYDLVNSSEGKITLEKVEKAGDSFTKALAKAWGTTTVEYVTERMGVMVDKPLDLLKRAIFAKWLIGKGITTPSLIAKLQEKIAWNGIIGEVFEEELAELAQAPIEEREYKAPFVTPEGLERLLVETLGIGAFGGLSTLSDVLIRQAAKITNKKTITEDNIVDELQKTPETAIITPQQARDNVVGTPLENTTEGKEVIKASFQAEQQNKNIKLDVKEGKIKVELVELPVIEPVGEGELGKEEVKITSTDLEFLRNWVDKTDKATLQKIQIDRTNISPTKEFAKDLSDTKIKEMADYIEKGSGLPPIIVEKAPIKDLKTGQVVNGYYVRDGIHRIAVFERLGFKEIPALIYETEKEGLTRDFETVSLEELEKFLGKSVTIKEYGPGETAETTKEAEKAKVPSEAEASKGKVGKTKVVTSGKDKGGKGKVSPIRITRELRTTLQNQVRELLQPIENAGNIPPLLNKLIEDYQDKPEYLKVFKAELRREMFSISGADTGYYKTDFAHMEQAKKDSFLGPFLDELERGISSIDALLETEPKKAPSGFADMGGYADLDNYPAETEEEKKQQREEVKYFTDDLINVEFPELLKLAKELTGNVPFLKKFTVALGKFYPKGEGVIGLSSDIFKDPKLAVRVFAHELGHLLDFVPEETMKRGNILGRIASLKGYMGSFLKEYPDAPEELITEKDRVKLRKEAKAQATKGVGVNQKVTPEDILNVWRSVESQDPGLAQYIAKLSDEDKVEIAKAAMKGEVHQFIHYQKAGIDVKRVYEDLLREEIIRRRLFEKKQIMKELKELSMLWKPFDPNENSNYTKYRFSSVELYADAISVMMVRPDLFESKAPQFFKAFFNYLDNKPLAKSTFFDLQDLLNKGEEAVLSDREQSIREMFKKGEDLFKAKIAEQKEKDKDYLFRLKYELVDKNQKVIDLVNKAKKEGKKVSDDDNPIFWLEGHNYVGGVQKAWVESKINPIYKSLTKANVTWEDFGEVLFLERAINERGELANPLGFDPQTAQKQIDFLKKTMGKEKWAAIEENLPNFRSAIKSILEDPAVDDFYSAELLKEMRVNPAYATYQVLDYFDTYIPASIKHQVGTLKEIANPATSTVVKTLSIIRAIERNVTKGKIVKFLKDNFEDEIQPAKTVWNGKSHVPIEPTDRDIALFTVMEAGKYTGYYVDPYIAATMERQTIGNANAVIEVLNFFNSKGFRPLFITYNTGFQTFNAVRDFVRLYKNLPTYNLFAVFKEYIKALPASFKRAFDIPDKTIQEMEEAKILNITYNDIVRGLGDEEKQIDAVLSKYGLSPVKTNKHFLRKTVAPFEWILDLVAKTGNMIETLPKVAAYRALDGKLPSKELASYIRTSAGSPDFMRRGNGYKWYNNVFLFSNAIKEGLRADYHVATGPKTRSGFWIKSAIITFLPKLLMLAAASGIFGEILRKMFDNVSEYDKSNYTIIPLTSDQGKTIYIRIPQDETGRVLGGIFWKALNIANSKQGLDKHIFDIVSIAGGQVPSLTPVLTAAFSAAQYATGNNPYDFFRGRNVLTDTEFKAGTKYSFMPFAVWEFQTLGGSLFWKSYVTEQGTEKRWYQTLIDAPVLSNIFGRWIRISNYGQKEQNQEIQREVDQEGAVRSLENKEALKKIVDEWNTSDKSNMVKSRLIQQYIESRVQLADPEDRSRVAGQAKGAVRTALVKGQIDANTDSLIYANTNEAKVKILQRVKSQMSDLEFKEYTELLLREGVISGNVMGELGRK